MTISQSRIDLLRLRYRESLSSKYADLTRVTSALLATPEHAAVRKDLRHILHRLAGSAPSYGYETLGELARAADRVLTAWEEEAAIRTKDNAADLAIHLDKPLRALLDALLLASAKPTPESNPLAIIAEPMQVIIIDNDIDQAKILGTQLEARGCKVRVVGDSRELWQFLAIWPCQAVVFDFWLNHEMAVEVATLLRSEPTFSAVALCCVTLEDGQKMLDAAIAAGCDAALRKNEAGPDHLYSTLIACVARRRGL